MKFSEWSGKPINPCFKCGDVNFSSHDCPVCNDQQGKFARWLDKAPERAAHAAKVDADRVTKKEADIARWREGQQEKQAARDVIDRLPVDRGTSNDPVIVDAVRLLRSGWNTSQTLFFAISGGGRMARFWKADSENLPKWAHR